MRSSSPSNSLHNEVLTLALADSIDSFFPEYHECKTRSLPSIGNHQSGQSLNGANSLLALREWLAKSEGCRAKSERNIPGAIYHLMSRGDRKEDIYHNDADTGEAKGEGIVKEELKPPGKGIEDQAKG